MSKPIFVLAGQSNGRRMADEVRENLTARYGENGFIVIQLAIAGAGLTWENTDRGDWYTPSELPAQLLSEIHDAVHANPDAHAAGMIWVHGESDTRQGADPTQYGELFNALVQRIQTEIPALNTAAARSFSDMPVVISQLAEASSEYFERVGWDTVIFEQGELAVRVDGIELVDPDAVARASNILPAQMFADNLHYTDAFNKLLADQLIDRVLAMDTPDRAATLPMFGSRDADLLVGSDSDDVMRGGGGADDLSGGDGNDRLLAGRSDDVVLGGLGQDRIWGHRGNDDLRGEAGEDRIFGGFGNDQIRGGSGDDLLKGGGGKDRLWGGDGADHIYGGTWRDDLYGGRGDDFLFGGAGRDVLRGGDGNDVLTGGRINQLGDRVEDIFVFTNTPSAFPEYDRIKDFEPGVDRIDVSDFGFVSFQQVLTASVPSGYGVELTLSGDHFLLLQNIDRSNLSADDFLL